MIGDLLRNKKQSIAFDRRLSVINSATTLLMVVELEFLLSSGVNGNT